MIQLGFTPLIRVFCVVNDYGSNTQQFACSATLKIMRKLHLTGSCHVQFALDLTTQNYYVIKVTPYFDRTMALAARATEYPLAQVVGNLMVGISLAEVKLPGAYRKQTALIEPVLDHIVCRIPVWPFNVLKKVSHQLDTVTESTGSVIGTVRSLGRSLVEGVAVYGRISLSRDC